MATTPAIKSVPVTPVATTITPLLDLYEFHGRGVLRVKVTGVAPVTFEVAYALQSTTDPVVNADAGFLLTDVAAGEEKHLLLPIDRGPYIRVRGTASGVESEALVEIHRPPAFTAYPAGH